MGQPAAPSRARGARLIRRASTCPDLVRLRARGAHHIAPLLVFGTVEALGLFRRTADRQSADLTQARSDVVPRERLDRFGSETPDDHLRGLGWRGNQRPRTEVESRYGGLPDCGDVRHFGPALLRRNRKHADATAL